MEGAASAEAARAVEEDKIAVREQRNQLVEEEGRLTDEWKQLTEEKNLDLNLIPWRRGNRWKVGLTVTEQREVEGLWEKLRDAKEELKKLTEAEEEVKREVEDLWERVREAKESKKLTEAEKEERISVLLTRLKTLTVKKWREEKVAAAAAAWADSGEGRAYADEMDYYASQGPGAKGSAGKWTGNTAANQRSLSSYGHAGHPGGNAKDWKHWWK